VHSKLKTYQNQHRPGNTHSNLSKLWMSFVAKPAACLCACFFACVFVFAWRYIACGWREHQKPQTQVLLSSCGIDIEIEIDTIRIYNDIDIDIEILIAFDIDIAVA
jgi:hypothetical protein